MLYVNHALVMRRVCECVRLHTWDAIQHVYVNTFAIECILCDQLFPIVSPHVTCLSLCTHQPSIGTLCSCSAHFCSH